MPTTTRDVRVLRPYQTFEGHTRYMVVREQREVPVTLSVVISR